MRNLEHEIPGFLGLAGDLQSRIAALGEDDLPTQWTPEHVGVRLVEAFRLMTSEPRVGPRIDANGWPEYRQEFGDRTGSIEDDAPAEKQEPATAGEASRRDEAMRWPATYLKGDRQAADAVMTWTYVKATGGDMDDLLKRRKKRAAALAGEMMRRANADPHAGDCRSIADQWRAARRRQIAAEVASNLNDRLALFAKDEHPAMMKAAQDDFRRLCRAENCLPYKFGTRDAAPDRIMTRTWLDFKRKLGMAAIAAGLRRQGVPVR